MASNVSQVGLRAVGGGLTTPTAIAASTALVLPTAAQRGEGGVLQAVIQVEVQSARWTTNGVTPTAAIGMLLAPASATVGTSITIVGEDALAAFRIIQAVAGSLVTYQFYKADNR